MTRQLRKHERCLDCDAPVAGNFCGECGQENSDYRVSLRRLLGDLFEEIFQIESRLWRSLWNLVRHPGLLTRDYNLGRRVRWTSPLRMYLVASVAFFFVDAMVPPPVQSDVTIDFSDGAGGQQLPAAKSPFEHRIYSHLGLDAGADMKLVRRRANELLAQNIPKVMALLVPLFALLTWLFFRRPKLFYVEHLTLALHLHALAFWLFLLGELTLWPHASMVAGAAAVLWLALAARALFAQSWWKTLSKLGLIVSVYMILVVGGILAALVI